MKSNVSKAGKTGNRRQHGGTILGIIIGLVIGLAIAVVVAIMITKTSTPFTNKLGLTKSDSPTVQLTDPNKPLYGSSAKELMANANHPDAGAAPNEQAIVPAQPAPVEPVRPPDPVKTDTKTDARIDTRGDAKADAKTAKSGDSVVAKNDADTSVYFLQVGAFRDAGDAESARAKLALIGVEAQVANSDGDNLYRVRIGPFTQFDNVTRMRNKLSDNNIDVAVIKTPK